MALIERILLVESDPDLSDLIARQALRPLGYQVDVAGDAGSAIKQAASAAPDLVIANLSLPGLSGKDLLVALASQGVNTPLIVLAQKGHEQDVIQAFRLGAADYLLLPARDVEVVSVVERVLKNVRETHARQRLDTQLKETNEKLQRKVHELTSIVAAGKAILSITDRRVVFERIIEGAIQVSGADMGWLLLRDDRTRAYLLVSQRNLPEAWAKKTGQPLDDGVSSLVAVSGETLLIHGDPLSKFRLSGLGKAAAVTPIKVKQEVIGLLVVVRKAVKAFGEIEQTLLEAMADYASISLVNDRLFRALEHTAETARNGEKRQNAMLESLRKDIQAEMQGVVYPLSLVLTGKTGALTPEQREALASAETAIQRMVHTLQKNVPPV
jgi:DNA-binding response OmpR family regulator